MTITFTTETQRDPVQPGAQMQVKTGKPLLRLLLHSDPALHGELKQAGSTSHKSPPHPSAHLHMNEGPVYNVVPFDVSPTSIRVSFVTNVSMQVLFGAQGELAHAPGSVQPLAWSYDRSCETWPLSETK